MVDIARGHVNNLRVDDGDTIDLTFDLADLRLEIKADVRVWDGKADLIGINFLWSSKDPAFALGIAPATPVTCGCTSAAAVGLHGLVKCGRCGRVLQQ